VKSSSSLGAGTAGAETESASATGTASVGFLLTFVPPCEQWTSVVALSFCATEGLLCLGFILVGTGGRIWGSASSIWGAWPQMLPSSSVDDSNDRDDCSSTVMRGVLSLCLGALCNRLLFVTCFSLRYFDTLCFDCVFSLYLFLTLGVRLHLICF
jgi:hypothetical protein